MIRNEMQWSTMSTTRTKERRVVRGIVVPSEWDDDGNVTGISLETDTELDYRLSWNGNGKKLLKYLKDFVEITGVVSEDEEHRLGREPPGRDDPSRPLCFQSAAHALSREEYECREDSLRRAGGRVPVPELWARVAAGWTGRVDGADRDQRRRDRRA